jgi:hypothetical protein
MCWDPCRITFSFDRVYGTSGFWVSLKHAGYYIILLNYVRDKKVRSRIWNILRYFCNKATQGKEVIHIHHRRETKLVFSISNNNFHFSLSIHLLPVYLGSHHVTTQNETPDELCFVFTIFLHTFQHFTDYWSSF